MTQSSPNSPESLYSDHLLNQIHSNLDLLLLQAKISRESVAVIKNALPQLSSPPDSRHRHSVLTAQASAPSPHPQPTHQPTYPQPQHQPHPPSQAQHQEQHHHHQNQHHNNHHNQPFHAPPPPPNHPPPNHPPPQQHKHAKALWAYRGSAADDLSFDKGDIIVVLAEENEDWWKGQVLNSQAPPGLFPSNHVEVMSTPNAAQMPDQGPKFPPAPQSYQAPPGSAYRQDHPPGPYPPPPQHQPGPPQGWQAPGYGQPNYYGDAKASQPVPYPPPLEHTQSAPPAQITVEKPKKKPLQGRFGQALVGGAGFGAGSAVATHVVNAIL